MPKGTRKTKSASTAKVFGGQAYYTNANKSGKMKTASKAKATIKKAAKAAVKKAKGKK